MSPMPQKELVLAAATGSTGGLGKVTTLVATTGTLIVRCPNDGPAGRSADIDWRLKIDQASTAQPYRARSVVNAATITLGTAALDDGDGFTLNGLVYTAEATATTADFASRKYSIAGNTAAQCTELAALINADYAITTAGTSVAGTDKLTFVTDEGTFVIVAAAAADYPAGKYALSGTAATEMASIVLAINHRDTITIGTDATSIAAAAATTTGTGYALSIELIADHNTHTGSTAFHTAATAAKSSTAATTEATLIAQANACREAMYEHYRDTVVHGGVTDATNLKLVSATTKATNEATAWTLLNALKTAHDAHIATAKLAAGDSITINDITFTAHATTTTAASREFSISGNASADADELCTCINDGTYGVSGVTAVNTSGAIALTRNTSAPLRINAVKYRHPHTPAVVTKAGGVPGILAAASGATNEIKVTPVWTAALTLTEAGDQLTVVDIDNPGLYAVAGATTVALSCTTPGNPVGGEKATVIQFVLAGGAQAADDAEATFASTTLTYLTKDGSATTISATNATTSNGQIISQTINGWEQAYLLVSNTAASPATVTVGATKY